MKKKIMLVALFSMVCAFSAHAQFDMQARWEFLKGEQHPSFEFKFDKTDRGGGTYIRVDYDMNFRDNQNLIAAPNRIFLDFERDFNFWQNTALGLLSAHVEYNGGLTQDSTIRNSFMAGLDCAVINTEKSKLNIRAMYRYTMNTDQKLPLQFSAKFSFLDAFNMPGLSIVGYADLNWTHHKVTHTPNMEKLQYPRLSMISIVANPQIWYNVGQHFNLRQLNVGGQVSLRYDYGYVHGFYVLPSAGIKWEF